MNLKELRAAFEQCGDDHGEFERIENPAHPRPDLCAFLMLSQLVPGQGDMVSAAEHDEIFLITNCERLAEVVTVDQVRDLARCGVRYSSEYDCLSMFV